MREWHDKGELVQALAQARREARDHGPRMSNDEQEAAMFLAMCYAMERLRQSQEPDQPAPEPVSADVPEPEQTIDPPEPHVVTEEPEHPPKRSRRKKSEDEDGPDDPAE